MNKYLIMLGIGVGLLAAGYVTGRYFQPARIETKTVEKEVIKKDIRTVIKEVKSDGTQTTTEIVDNSESWNTSVEQFKAMQKPQWKAQVLVGVKDFKLSDPIYGVGVERRVLGPFSAGVYGKTNNEYGLTLSMEF